MDWISLTVSTVVAGIIGTIIPLFLNHGHEQKMQKLHHTLEKEKRLYESKLAQYKQYWKKIDDNNNRLMSKFINEKKLSLFLDTVDATDDEVAEQFKGFISSQIETSMEVSNLASSELNSFRLEASPRLLKVLDEYLEGFKDVIPAMTGLLDVVITELFAQRASEHPLSPEESSSLMLRRFSELSQENETLKKLKLLEHKLFSEMRIELGVEPDN